MSNRPKYNYRHPEKPVTDATTFDIPLPSRPSQQDTPREVHEYTCLVHNLAALVVQQCNLFQKQVPDAITENFKAETLANDVINVVLAQAKASLPKKQ